MNLRAITRNIALALLLDAGFMLASAAVAAYYRFDASFSPLLLSGLLTLMVAILPLVFVSKGQMRITTRDGMLILFFAWLLSCVFGLLPYALYGGEFTLENAWFESASGFTATGASILQDVESLPRGLQFWRHSTQFIGGLGVVVFMLIILPSSGTVKLRMRRLEVSNISAGDYNFRSNKIVSVVLTVYLIMMLSCALLYLLAGMPLYDAVCHAFSTVATGGFSTRSASLGAYDSRWIELIAMFFMLASSLHYGQIYSSVAGRNLGIFRNPIVKFFFASIAVGIVLSTISLMFTGTCTEPLQALWQSAFCVISAGSSTGLATADTASWPALAVVVLLYFSVQCGCSGSTTGGLKADRIWLLARAVKAQVVSTIHPNTVVRVKWGAQSADMGVISSVAAYTLLYFVIMFVCAAFYAACGMSLSDSISDSLALVGNVGPAYGAAGSLGTYADVPILAKVVMGFEMIVSRLGIYAFFSMFAKRN